MRLLLDTHLLVWSMTNPGRIRADDLAMIRDRAHSVMFSVASIWEVAIKYALRRPDFDVDPAALANAARVVFDERPIEAAVAIRVASLAHHHRDPFDRLLVAQAVEDDAMLFTVDRTLTAYGPHVLLTAPESARVPRP